MFPSFMNNNNRNIHNILQIDINKIDSWLTLLQDWKIINGDFWKTNF